MEDCLAVLLQAEENWLSSYKKSDVPHPNGVLVTCTNGCDQYNVKLFPMR